MATILLRPDTIQVGTDNVDVPSIIEDDGGDPNLILSDDTDDTWVQVATSSRVGHTTQDHIIASFPAFSQPVTTATLYMRTMYTLAGNAVQPRFEAQAETPSSYVGTFLTDEIDAGSSVPSTGVIYDLTTWDFVDFVSFPDDPLPNLIAALATGTCQINISALSDFSAPPAPPADWIIRVYELGLLIDYSPRRRYRRQFPRDNRRLFPPPTSLQSGRLAGGYL